MGVTRTIRYVIVVLPPRCFGVRGNIVYHILRGKTVTRKGCSVSSNKTDTDNKNKAFKTEKDAKTKRVPVSVRFYDQDPSYWGMPFYERAYLRVMYAFFAFIVTASFFDSFTGAPMWMQLLLGGSVALATLLFRCAYPKGFNSIWEWIMEGMEEAAAEMEAAGKTPKMSSKEIREKLVEQRALDKKRNDNANKSSKTGKGAKNGR